MPRKQRRSKARTKLQPTPAEWAFMCGTEPPPVANKFQTLELECGSEARAPRMVQLWSLYRDRILRAWIRERPGTRPRCWWIHDAPRGDDGKVDPRQQVGARCRRACTPRNEYSGYCLYCGPANPARFESVPAYLARHRLLLPGERRKLAAADFEPVTVTVLDYLHRHRERMAARAVTARDSERDA